MLSRTGIGVDVGSHTVKIVWLRRGLRDVDMVRCVVLARSRLAAQAGEATDDLGLAAALKANLMELGLKVRHATVGLSGRETIFRLTQLPARARASLAPLTAREAEQIAGGADVCYDFRLVNLPTPTINELSVLLAVAKLAVAQQRLATLDAAGVRAAMLCPNAQALHRAYLLSRPDVDDTVVLLDIGDAVSEVAVVRSGQLIFSRGLSPAGRDFTEAIRRSQAVSATKAEQIKHTTAEVAARPGQSDTDEALRAVAQQLAKGVQSTLQLCRTQAGLARLEIGRVLVSGGGARLKGLTECLAAELNMPVSPLDPLCALRLPALRDEPGRGLAESPTPLAVAVGLAAMGLTDAAELDLMPPQRRERLRFARQGAFSLVGGLLLLAAVVVMCVAAVRNASALGQIRSNLEEKLAGAAAQWKETDKLAAQNRRLVRVVELLGSTTRPGLLFADSLAAIQEALPKAARLTQVTEHTEGFAPPAADGLPVPEIALVASGVIQEADQLPIDVLNGFVDALSKDARIAELKMLGAVEREESEARGVVGSKVLDFSIRVVPRPPELRDRPAGSPAGRGREGRSG